MFSHTILRIGFDDIFNFGLTGTIIGIVYLVIWLWAIIDALRGEYQYPLGKLIWILTIVLLPVLGIVLYFFLGRHQKLNQERT